MGKPKDDSNENGQLKDEIKVKEIFTAIVDIKVVNDNIIKVAQKEHNYKTYFAIRQLL